MIWSLRDGVAQESTNGRRSSLAQCVNRFSNTEALGMIDDNTILFDIRFLIIIKKKIINSNYNIIIISNVI